jgi:glycosyltransferase involved in cell wall biosynthesis
MTSFDPGGTERQMIELIRRLDPERFTVHAVCFRREGAWLPRVTERAASIVEFPIRGFSRPGTIVQAGRFARWCRRERIAIVQTCDFYANCFGLPAAWLGGVPVRIGSRRELNPDKSPAQIRLQRTAFRTATRVVANSPAAARILSAEGVPAGVCAVIPNGIDAARFAPTAREPRIRTVVMLANLRPEKSHETLIAAAALLLPAHPFVRYRIVGAGARRAALEDLARARGVDHLFDFLGHREDVPELLARADLFVLTSRSEAFPNGVLEAMASGLPVVASGVGGLVDLVRDGETGVLVPPGDPRAFAAAMDTLIRNPERAAGLGAAARRDVLARYSFERMVGAFEDLYAGELHGTRALGVEAAQAGI